MKRPICSYCRSAKVIGNGYHVSKMDNKTLYKRWKCKKCNKTFSRRYWREPVKTNKKRLAGAF